MTPSPTPSEGEAMLKPCPFCGGACKLEIGSNNFHSAQVVCSDCGTFGPNFDDDAAIGVVCENPSAEAIRHWNTRAAAQSSSGVREASETDIERAATVLAQLLPNAISIHFDGEACAATFPQDYGVHEQAAFRLVARAVLGVRASQGEGK